MKLTQLPQAWQEQWQAKNFQEPTAMVPENFWLAIVLAKLVVIALTSFFIFLYSLMSAANVMPSCSLKSSITS